MALFTHFNDFGGSEKNFDFLMNFRSAKNLQKSEILEPEGRQNALREVSEGAVGG